MLMVGSGTGRATSSSEMVPAVVGQSPRLCLPRTAQTSQREEFHRSHHLPSATLLQSAQRHASTGPELHPLINTAAADTSKDTGAQSASQSVSQPVSPSVSPGLGQHSVTGNEMMPPGMLGSSAAAAALTAVV